MRQPTGVVKRRRAARRYQSQEAPVPWSRRSRTIARAIRYAAFQSSRDHGVASILETDAVDFRVSDSFDTSALLVSGLGPGVVLETPARPASRPSWTQPHIVACPYACQRLFSVSHGNMAV